MTADNQNKDFHWTNHNHIKSRLSGSHLTNENPCCKLSDLPNGSVLLWPKDHINNRKDYIVLVEYIIVDYLPSSGFLKSSVEKHIPHMYSSTAFYTTTTIYAICLAHVLDC